VIEEDVVTTIGDLVGGRVFPITVPEIIGESGQVRYPCAVYDVNRRDEEAVCFGWPYDVAEVALTLYGTEHDALRTLRTTCKTRLEALAGFREWSFDSVDFDPGSKEWSWSLTANFRTRK
jgi:hypothetical protein